MTGSPSEARQLVLSGQVDFEREAVLERPGATRRADCSPGSPAAGMVVPQFLSGQPNPNRLDIQVSSPADGWLVVSDAWYPGWRAWVDGKETRILRADYLFRAVAVPAGKHQVVLAYQPLSFWGGATLSLFSLLALIFVSMRLRRGQAGEGGRE